MTFRKDGAPLTVNIEMGGETSQVTSDGCVAKILAILKRVQ